ncbi:MAG: carbohydrate porin, partial [Stellaceae bacterium]
QQHRGNYSIYAVADQMVWQDSDDPGHNLSLFARVMGTPETNRNLVDFNLNAGLNVHGLVPGRDDDTFGLAMGFAKVSPTLAGLDRDTQYYTGSYTPARNSETFIEATYQYAVTPWLQLQPDNQYVFNPGGGIANPSGTSRVADELVLGMRTNITF